MKQKQIARALITQAVRKGIKDIQDNPRRGVRNLVELGAQFARGQFQREFFHAAQKELDMPSSPYYTVAENLIRNTDLDILTTFGMNLGYQCFTYGADKIRHIEAEQGFNVPWTLLFDLREAQDADMVHNFITQGKELGIYCYIFFLSEKTEGLGALLDVIGEAPGCAFVLHIPPGLVSPELIEFALAAKNTALVLELRADNRAAVHAAVAALSASGCLFAGYACAENWRARIQVLLREAQEAGFSIFIFLDELGRPQAAYDTSIVEARERLTAPVIPIDILQDVATVDRNISSEACIAVVRGDGSLSCTAMEGPGPCCTSTVHGATLQDSFRRMLQKATLPPALV